MNKMASQTDLKKDLNDYVAGCIHLGKQYAEDVQSGKIVAGNYIKLAVERYNRDLENPAYIHKWNEVERFFKFCYFVNVKQGNKYKRFKPFPFQAFAAINLLLFYHSSDPEKRRFRYYFLFMARKNGKALGLDTPIPTPEGWTKMGDIKIGDKIFDEQGNITNVTNVTPVQYNRNCYRVVFSDGEEIIADADHQWEVQTKASRRTVNRKIKSNRRLVRTDYREGLEGYFTTTTKDMVDDYYRVRPDGRGSDYKYRVPVAKPLELPEKDLLINPYLLGQWLGDGTSRRPTFTTDVADAGMYEFIKDLGYHYRTKTEKNRTAKIISLEIPHDQRTNPHWRNFTDELRALSLIKNKHIPPEYLRGSLKQRLALLQGIMDTDGTVSKSGQCEIQQKSKLVVDGLSELLSSLGITHTIKEKNASCNASDCGVVYRVTFFTDKTLPCFRLQRKYNRLKDRLNGRMLSKSIVKIEKVDSVPVRCLEVDSPNHLYLAGKRMTVTHNSVFASVLALYFLIGDKELDPTSLVVASTREQAGILLDYGKNIVLNSPKLQQKLEIMQYSIRYQSGNSRGVFKVLPNNASRLDGYNQNCAILDEIHSYTDDSLFKVIKSAILARKNPITILISTAGFNQESFCNDLVEMCKSILKGDLQDESFFAMLYMLDEDDDYRDSSNWIKSNPALGEIISLEDLEIEYRQSENMSSLLNNFLTKNLNVFTSSIDQWIDDAVLAKAFCQVDNFTYTGKPCWVGIDLSSTRDLTSIVYLFYDDVNDRYNAIPYFFMANNPAKKLRKGGIDLQPWIDKGFIIECETKTIDYEMIYEHIIEKSQLYEIQSISYDQFNSALLIPRLEDAGLTCIPFKQTAMEYNFPMKFLEKYLYDERINLSENTALKWNFQNVVLYQDGNGNIKVVKNRAKDSVDGVVALAMAMGGWIKSNIDPESIGLEQYLQFKE